MTAPLLEVEKLVAAYGRGPAALTDINLSVDAGSMVGIVGINGAGKSTLMRSISGGLKPRSGTIRFEGNDISGRSTADLARAGIVLLSEGHRTIRPLTVTENLQISTMSIMPGRVNRRVKEMLPMIYELFPVLEERKKQLAGLLSGGEQQMLSVARAMIQGPKLLLLDEPSLGLAPLIVERIYTSFESLRQQGISMVIVEQNSIRVAQACSNLIVLRDGRITASGSSADLHGGRLHEAYFG